LGNWQVAKAQHQLYRMNALIMPHGTGAFLCLLVVLAPLTMRGQVTNAPAPSSVSQPKETVRIPLSHTDSESFPGDAAAKDFFLQLPEHVSFQPGCELRLALYPSREVLARLCTIIASINGSRLSGASVEGKSLSNDLVIRLRFPLPAGSLAPGWNRVALRFVLNKPAAGFSAAQGPGTWTIRRMDSDLKVVYQRSTLFPEVVRFPGSLAEEKLLRPPEGHADSEPALALLLPASMRDVHLRACAIIGARLGQLGYLSSEDCRLDLTENWQAEQQERNGIVVGLRAELGSLALPPNLADKLASLQPEQGMVAEFIVDSTSKQRRWLVVAGADDAGLEKAVLTLGSASALAAAPPNPSLIEEMPVVSVELEGKTQPGLTRVALKDWGISQVRLSGIHTMAQSIPGWRLPPGYDLASGVLELQFSHSPTLLNPGSWVDVMVDGIKAGTIELTPKNAASGSAKVALPKGFSGRDPMMLTFRAHLDLSPSECDQRKEDEPWLVISGDSTLETSPALMQVHGLNQFGRLLLRDSFLRRAAIVTPRVLSLEELGLLIAISMRLGQQLPSSPVLWPEVCTYSKTSPAQAARLKDRSVLVLGSIGQWPDAVPPEAPTLLKITDDRIGAVRMQGYAVNMASFEPSLAFMQMTPSPWSQGEWLVAAGGWHEFASPALLRLLTDPKVADDMHGNVCAMDASGRVAAYDSRSPARDSMAERIYSRIPLGLSADETRERIEAQRAHLRRHGWINTAVFYACGALVGFIVAFRVVLMWERAYLLRQNGREQAQPLESAS
jgi:hypothetical protein